VAASLWQSIWWSTFAQLPEDRICYRLIKKRKIASIMEIGLNDGVRTERMLQIALRTAGPRVVNYVGIDLFEAHPDPEDEPLTLKQAHQTFAALGARVKLIPGDAHGALSRNANLLKDIELVVISYEHEPETLAKCWNLMPRFLTDDAIVLRQGDEQQNFRFDVLTVEDVKQLAAENSSKGKPKKAA